MNYSSSSSPIRGYTRNSRRLSQEDTPSSSFPERIRQILPVARVGGGHRDWGTTPELCDYEGQRSLKHP